MKALSLPRPFAWALLTGHIDIYRQPGLPVHAGRLLIHVGDDASQATTRAALRQVAERSGTDMALLRNAYDQQCALQAITGAVTVTGLGWDFASGGAEPVSYDIAGACRAFRPVSCHGCTGFFDVPQAVIDELDIPGYVEAT